MATMKAAVYYGKGDIRIQEVPVPEPTGDQVQIKVEWCGICGTDIHEYHDGPVLVPNVDKPHPITKATLPLTLGHEFSGTITKIGPDVDKEKYKVGTRVCAEPIITCGECKMCKEGFENCCPKLGWIGLADHTGGFAEYALARQFRAHPIPDSISFEIGALMEPLSVAWHAVRVSNIKMGQTALVLGGGPIGIMVLRVLLAIGAREVFVSEMSGSRKSLALKSGAKAVFDPRECDVVAECKKASVHGLGVDVAFDCAGVQASITTAINAVRPRGTIMNVAIWEKPIQISLNDMALGEKWLSGCICFADDFPAVIAAVADGRLSTDGLISGHIEIDDLVEKGFNAILNEKDKHVKIIARPVKK